jgi:hypothetical protein
MLIAYRTSMLGGRHEEAGAFGWALDAVAFGSPLNDY